MESLIEIVFFIALLFAIVPLVGKYLALILQDTPTWPFSFVGAGEKGLYRFLGINPYEEMTPKEYIKAMLIFNFWGFSFLFLILILQGILPLNPERFNGVEPFLAFNIAVSFVTNTNWQAYGGETTLSNLSQMLGLTVQNFLSAATGFAPLLCLIRGLKRTSSKTIGNFWKDLIRSVIYILLPFALVFAFFLISQGVIQTFEPYATITTLENATQKIPLGPVASQVSIKQLGSNGGGFFNANSAHPFENPTPLSNFFEGLALIMIPAASIYMYGLMAKAKKQSILIFSVMALLWILGLAIGLISENYPNPNFHINPVFEGKEARIGNGRSVLWAITTTGTSNGSINCMHSSLSPLTGGLCLLNMLIGEVIFGGVGVGLAGMLFFAILTVFLSGLMVGRTPEFLGKKIEKTEMKWVMLVILGPAAKILIGTSIALSIPSIVATLSPGPHGLTEIVYAFASAAGNNGSAFSSLNANTVFFNLILGFIMLIARWIILVCPIVVGGLLAKKESVAVSLGTFSTDTPLFGVLLFFAILIIAALTFFPVLTLGPILEEILMLKGYVF